MTMPIPPRRPAIPIGVLSVATPVFFALYSAACLLAGVWPWQLHLALLVVQLAFLASALLTLRSHLRRSRYLLRLTRLNLLCRAWESVLRDRVACGRPGITHARLGLFRSLDLAHSEVARGPE